MYQLLLAVAGLGLSVYAYAIQKKLEADKEYKPFCDLSDAVSCVKPLKSPYSSLFGIGNGLVGIIFYTILIACIVAKLTTFVCWLSTAAVIASIWFGYLLYVKIKSVCIVCTALYIVNILLFLSC